MMPKQQVLQTDKHVPTTDPAPKQWWLRHLGVILISVAGLFLFLESRSQWSEMHRWNRAVGDMGLVLIAASMAIGPVARIWRQFNPVLPWRRECGIYGVVLSLIHGVIVLVGWVEFDLMRLVGFEFHPAKNEYVMIQHGFGLANVIGLVALLYGALLAAVSNDLSIRRLSQPVWKFVQQGAYVLWMLSVIHTAYFLYIHFLHFHRPMPEPNWAQWPFAILVMFVSVLQFIAFSKTWLSRRNWRAQKSHATETPGT